MPNCLSYHRMDELVEKLGNEMPIEMADRRDLIAALLDLVRCRKHIAKLRAEKTVDNWIARLGTTLRDS